VQARILPAPCRKKRATPGPTLLFRGVLHNVLRSALSGRVKGECHFSTVGIRSDHSRRRIVWGKGLTLSGSVSVGRVLRHRGAFQGERSCAIGERFREGGSHALGERFRGKGVTLSGSVHSPAGISVNTLVSSGPLS